MFSKHLKDIIFRNNYTKEWRLKTARCLVALGMSESGIEKAITGSLDQKSVCRNVCNAEKVNFEAVWKLLR